MSDREHPFLTAISKLPERFPELGGNDQLAQIARLIVIPAMRSAARKDPDAVRAATVRFLARFVTGLEIAPQEIFGALEIGAARTALEASSDPKPTAGGAPAPSPDLERVLRGDV